MATRSGARAPCVHRRDVDHHQHDPQPRPLRQRRATANGLTSRASQDHHAGRRSAHVRNGRADGARRGDQRRLVRSLCRPGSRAPELRPRDIPHLRGDRPIMDNLSSHKRASVQALRNAFLTAQLGNAVIAAQAFQHDPDLAFSGKMSTGLTPDVLHHLLRRLFGA